ncbi:unnamed protein product, partial [Heterosigma akashiwo]
MEMQNLRTDNARAAYYNLDPEASRIIHDSTSAAGQHRENHKGGGEYVKAMIFGGLDGILTSFAIVAGAVGGGLAWQSVLILGFSNILADALSMGVGEYLSSKAHNEYVLSEKKREVGAAEPQGGRDQGDDRHLRGAGYGAGRRDAGGEHHGQVRGFLRERDDGRGARPAGAGRGRGRDAEGGAGDVPVLCLLRRAAPARLRDLPLGAGRGQREHAVLDGGRHHADRALRHGGRQELLRHEELVRLRGGDAGAGRGLRAGGLRGRRPRERPRAVSGPAAA